MRIALLGNFHSLSNAAQYAKAFRALGHDVTTVGPGFSDYYEWMNTLTTMEWAPTEDEARAYVYKVLAESPVPDIETGKAEQYLIGRDDCDLVLKFEAYGETPIVGGLLPSKAVWAAIYGDTHTGRIDEYVRDARGYDHVFVQFLRADTQVFKDAGRKHVHWLPAAADPEVWFHAPDLPKKYDVLFVGSTHPKIHRDRVELLRYLKHMLGEDRVVVKHAFGTDAALLMNQARVVLNHSLAGDLNMRVPEAMCTGAALVTDWVDGLDYFSGQFWTYKALGPYSGPENCLGTIQELLAGNSLVRLDDVARQARAAIINEHTYRHRAQFILDTIFGEAHGTDLGRRTHSRTDPVPDVDAEPTRLSEPATVSQVSIIIPAYNHWQDATRSLLAYLNEHYWDLGGPEILLIDDGSTDNTKSIDVAAPASVFHKPNGGFASACNFGAQQAKGKYLVFLNNDTEPLTGWLDPLIEQLEVGAGIVGARMLDPNAPGDHLDGKYATQSAGLAQGPDGSWSNLNFIRENAPYEVAAVTGACFAVSRDLFWRAGGFDEGFKNGCEDVDLCLRVRQMGHTVMVQPASKVLHYEGTTRFALPGAREQVTKNKERLYERWGPDCTTEKPVDLSRRSEHRAVTRNDAPKVAWVGPTDPATGGSLSIINTALREELPKHGISLVSSSSFPPAPDLTVLHYFPGVDRHVRPDTPFCVVQPWEHGCPPDDWKATWKDSHFQQLWVPSEYCRQLYLQYHKELVGKVGVIPNGVDLDVFTPEGEQWGDARPDLFRFLFVGGAIWRKGVDILEAAWNEAFREDDPVRLIVKTTGSKTFYPNGLSINGPGVRHIDRDMDQFELATLYRTCDVVVQPSRAEAFCLPVLEAMAMNKPVIAPAYGPTTEYAEDYALTPVTRWKTNDAGMYYEIDQHDLARCLRYVYDYPDYPSEIGRERACDYSWHVIAQKYADAIKEILV